MSCFECGAIINWKDFYYSEKTKKHENKLFVILGVRESDKIIMAITTSQKHNKITTPGCYIESGYYMIDQYSNVGFPKDTWILLNDLKVISASELLQRSLIEKDISVVGSIKEHVFNGLVNCAKRSEDISAYHLGLIGK